jgi:hypothetical protein
MARVYLLLFLFSSSATAFIGPKLDRFPASSSKVHRWHRQHVHSAVVSPFSKELQQDLDHKETCQSADDNTLAELCHSLHTQRRDLLQFQCTPDGVRGVYLNNPVSSGDVILSLPLESCLADNTPPSWFLEEEEDASTYNPSSWATRLAASLIDMQLRHNEENLDEGHALWLSLLPDPEFLSASLPCHWEEETVQNARSTALELAVDSAYFARAQAVEDLVYSLGQSSKSGDMSDEELRSMCSNALDLVQTRSCRLGQEVIGGTLAPPLRVLAPIFDFINHGSMRCHGEAGANAQFQLEGGDIDHMRVVVRATRDLNAGDEVLIDYGASVRPAWKCLLSYGFVPQYNRIPGPGESTADDDDDDENEAEVYMDGVRFEVGPSSIPVEMVAAASAIGYMPDFRESALEQQDISLTPETALRIARRISDVAYQMLLEPERDMYDDHPAAVPTPFQVISNRLAASLRWSQHRVLLTCALGLRQFAADEDSFL